MERLQGRDGLLEQLERGVLQGSTLLLLGPLGMGKSSMLEALSARFMAQGRPCGLARTTDRLADVTAALASAYPGENTSSLTRRQLRGRLRLAVERRPGALLLDHISQASTATKGFLRSLRGTGLGVVLAADAENRRDHAAIRALHLTHLEVSVPPLPRATLAAILDARLARSVLPHPLHGDDRRQLLRLARGNPGRLVTLVQLLTDARFWHNNRVSVGSVNGAALEQMLQRYLAP